MEKCGLLNGFFLHIDCIVWFLPSVHWTRSDARISWRLKSAGTCRTIVLSTKWAHCWAVVACETDVLHLRRLSPSKYSRILPSTTSVLFPCWVRRFPEATCSHFRDKNVRVSEFPLQRNSKCKSRVRTSRVSRCYCEIPHENRAWNKRPIQPFLSLVPTSRTHRDTIERHFEKPRQP